MHIRLRFPWSLAVLIASFLFAATLSSSQGNHTIGWHVFSGGGAPAAAGSVRMNGSLGQTAIGPASSGSYHLHSGYWLAPPAALPAGHVYLPLAMRRGVSAPNLVVERVTATPDGVQVVIANRGYAPTSGSFWVDVYIDPHPAPVAANQVWRDVADQGLVWGIETTLEVGQSLTLAVGDAFYRAAYSEVHWPLALGTPVYAQVDSVNLETAYGAVLETHEMLGEPYADNVLGGAVAASGLAVTPETAEVTALGAGPLPPRR